MYHKRCICEGPWRSRRDKWVAIERKPTAVLVKCKTCNFKWWSNAGHAKALPDHVERRWPKMAESDVLAMIEAGLLHVDTAKGEVWKVRSDRCIRLNPAPDRQRGYLFVDIYRNGRRRRTAVHRVVMMATTLQMIPADREPDHKDRNITNNCISNLRLLTKTQNRRTNVVETF